MKNVTKLLALMGCMGAIFLPMNVLAEGTEEPIPIPIMPEQTLSAGGEIEMIPLTTAVPIVEPEDTPSPQPVASKKTPTPASQPNRAAEPVAKLDVMPEDIPEPTALVPTPTATPSPTPTATYEKPLTPDGQASIVDNVTEQDGKEFFTISTQDGNVFYLIVDRQKNSENIYFLNTVTEADLKALAEGDGVELVEATPVPTPTPQPTPEPTPEPEPEPEKGGFGGILMVLLVIAAAGGAGYYFKIYRPKQQAVYDDADDDYDENYDVDEDYPADKQTYEDEE